MAKCALIVLTCVLIASATALPNPSHKYPETLIVGGEAAAEGEIPYQLSIRRNNVPLCGGALVTVGATQVILTAAHCVDYGTARDYTVISGDVDWSDNTGNEQRRQVSRIIPHENFDWWTNENDIAVLLIDQGFDLDQFTSPISLPTKNQVTTGSVMVSGWGTLEDGGIELPNQLQKVTIPIVDDATCQKAYPNEKVTASMLCAGATGKDSCQGDSGSPLKAVSGGYLAGIVSWGHGCAAEGFPGVNTRVSHFVDWMQAVVAASKF